MHNTETTNWLSQAVAAATRSAKFCVSGSLPSIKLAVEIDGFGLVKLPLDCPIKRLVEQCTLAPYGKGTETLVDPRVRNAYELDPSRFRLRGKGWEAAIAETAGKVAVELGLSADQLEPKLYKLLVYPNGAFFVSHRDSEKLDRMVGSLIVVLPNPFQGGALKVRHGGTEQVFQFEDAAAGTSASFAAFYADCEHEVARVTRGCRIALAYNLVLKNPPPSRPSTKAPSCKADQALVSSIRTFTATQPLAPLVFALEHYYTERSLSLDLLKGGDRRLADVVVAASHEADCCVHLAQVTYHLINDTTDDSYDWRRSRWGRSRTGEIEVGSVICEDWLCTLWTNLQGKQQPLPEMRFDSTSLVSKEPHEQWKPTSEEYEGYTGNAGNTLDRWYHRSAIVLWSRENHFGILARANVRSCMQLLQTMISELARTPESRLEKACDDCEKCARAIIAHWPRNYGYSIAEYDDSAILSQFKAALFTLADPRLISLFLARLAEQDHLTRIDDLVVKACSEYGSEAFASELKQLITGEAADVRHRKDMLRELCWLAKLCGGRTAAEQTAVERELCALAVERFCQPPERGLYGFAYGRPEEIATRAQLLTLLVESLIATDSRRGLERTIKFVRSFPEHYPLRTTQARCLTAVFQWLEKRNETVPSPLVDWLVAVREELRQATAEPPMPPTNWARPASADCSCQWCKQLNEFLADPDQDVGRIRAAEWPRNHITNMIKRYGCDAAWTVERRGSPYTLVLTKTTGSYERAAKQYLADQQLLESLPQP